MTVSQPTSRKKTTTDKAMEIPTVRVDEAHPCMVQTRAIACGGVRHILAAS